MSGSATTDAIVGRVMIVDDDPIVSGMLGVTLFGLFVSGAMLLVKRRHEANQREHDDVIHLDDNGAH